MIKAEQIPPDAMYAAWKALNAGMTINDAIAAALAAWPGMSVAPIPRFRPYKEAETLQHIILPLQETPNAK
jgi:hypothetical protein